MSEKTPTDIYQALRERLDLFSIGFPATPSGVEITILKRLFSAEDARLFLELSPLLEPAETIAGKLGLPAEETRARLADMAGRGLLFSKAQEGTTLYGATPFVHGIFEYQVNRMDRELAKLMNQYGMEAFGINMIQNAGSFLRTIPVRQSLGTDHQVAAYDDAVEILKSKKTIVVTACICRKKQNLLGKGCGKIVEACFMFNTMAEYYLAHNLGRRITVDEAVAILEKAREQGLVTQPATAQNPAGMCNCCGDCCGVLQAINFHPKPAEIVSSNHYAVLDRDACTGCGTCLDRCQTKALTMDEDGLAALNSDRCIGCGLCVITCPSGALCLEAKATEDRYQLPRDSMEQMVAMAKKRGIL
ncbi:MAG: 4Fe-4S dicluster domain-containing protein [Thermodesulfobacteriota bacterium]